MATSRSPDDGEDTIADRGREEWATRRLRWPVAGRQKGLLVKVLRLVLRLLKKR